MKNRKVWLLMISVFILSFNIFLPCISASTSISEEWYKTWGEGYMSGSGYLTNRAKTLAIDSADNIYVAGDTEYSYHGTQKYSFSYIRLIKIDSSGIQQWNRTWNASQFDYCEEIALDSSGNIFLCGATHWNSAGAADICLIKYDAYGEEQWVRTWGGYANDVGAGLAIDSSDNIYIAGYTGSFGVGSGDLCLLKYDKSGVLQWNVTWGGTEGDSGTGIAIDSSGDIYVVGITRSFGSGEFNVCLLKYDSSGIQQWNILWGGDKDDIVYKITLDSEDNIYLTGNTENFGAGGKDLLLMKYNISGELQWYKTLGGSENEYGIAISSDSSDNIYIAGYTCHGKGSSDMYLLEFNSSGLLHLNCTWGGNFTFSFSAIAFDSSDDIYIAGTGGYNMILVKVLQDFDEPSTTTIPGYDSLFMICLICTILVFLIKKRYKLTKKYD